MLRRKYYISLLCFVFACGQGEEKQGEKTPVLEDSVPKVELRADSTDKPDAVRAVSPEKKEPKPIKDTTKQAKVPAKPVEVVKEKMSLAQSLVEMGLVDVQSLDPTIKVDVKYSTTDNFMKVDAYQDLDKIFLQKEVAEMLVKAHINLKKAHPTYHFLIFDGARPFRVQQSMWEIVKGTDKAHYVARPDAKGSMHNYGCGVDLTIADEKGKQLDMGTRFDYFGVLAHTDKDEVFVKQGKLTKQQVENRHILKQAMESVGFKVLKREWWHFNAFPDAVVLKKYKKIP